MIYFDNAATSYPKPDVVHKEMLKCMEEYCANPGRGGHKLSLQAGKAIVEAREIISNFFGIKNSMRLAFTKNATEALNIAINGVLKKGDHVITTCMEHNSVIRPLKHLQRTLGIEITIVEGNQYGEIDIDDIRKSIKKNTALLVSTFSSNVNGIVMPIKGMGDLAKEKEIFFLVDGSQGAGIFDIDVEVMNIDLFAFPGHKGLLGPQGTGGLFVREGIKINPLIVGGTGTHSESEFQPEIFPDVLESGTANTPGIVGLKAGVEYLRNIGIDKIKKHKHNLTKKFIEEVEHIEEIQIYSKKTINNNSGIVALNLKDVDSTELSYVLDKVYDVATRAGLHCSPLAHKALGTQRTGIVRYSFGQFNTIKEVDQGVKILKEIVKKL